MDYLRAVETQCSPLRLYMAMQSLYEKDKVFAVQQLVAKEGSKISYRDTSEEPKLLPELKLERKNILCLTDSEYGPPNKAQHFCEDDDFSPLPKTKTVHKKS